MSGCSSCKHTCPLPWPTAKPQHACSCAPVCSRARRRRNGAAQQAAAERTGGGARRPRLRAVGVGNVNLEVTRTGKEGEAGSPGLRLHQGQGLPKDPGSGKWWGGFTVDVGGAFLSGARGLEGSATGCRMLRAVSLCACIGGGYRLRMVVRGDRKGHARSRTVLDSHCMCIQAYSSL